MKKSGIVSKSSVKVLLLFLSISGLLSLSIKPLAAAVRSVAVGESQGDSKVIVAQNSQRIKFKPGASSAEVKGGVPRGSVNIYSVGANAGQTINVEIQSVEGNAVFKVIDPNTNTLAEEQKSWSGTLPLSGDYQIVVGTERGGASYTLSVEIK